MGNAEIDTLLAAWLRGDTGVNLCADLKGSHEAILARVEFHGIAGLLHNRPQDNAVLLSTLATELRELAIGLAFWEASHARLLARLLPALAAGGIRPLLFKGTALAYSHYQNPATRARGDTDILVAWEDYQRAGAIFSGLGLTSGPGVNRSNVSIEWTFTSTEAIGIRHCIDLHGKLSNAVLLARVLPFEELIERAVDLPGLGSNARAPGAVDALLIACLHRLVHLQTYYYVNGATYRSADRLIWLYDIDRLATGFSPRDWDRFQTLAVEKKICGACADGLGAALKALATPLPQGMIESLSRHSGNEVLDRYFKASQFKRRIMNMWAQDGLNRKVGYLLELVFPPTELVRARFDNSQTTWLPWLYARYLIGGLRKAGASRPGTK
jgi:hypothetical protein